MTEEKLREEERIERLVEKFNVWVNGDFKQLATKVHALVVDTDALVKQSETLLASTERCVKLSDDLVVLSKKVEERSREALFKVKQKHRPNS